jgi:hypothetical protein
LHANRITTIVVVFAMAVAACATGDRHFPLREPMRHDGDLASVRVPCHDEPTAKDPHHRSCAPAVYESPLAWDGADNLVFRPLSDALGIVTSGESVDVNSLDEVPDSSWFVNRIGARAMSVAELRQAACSSEQILDPDQAIDGSWVIDKGKSEGATPGFRVVVPGKGKFMLKVDRASDGQPERTAAACTISAAIFHAVGYFISCERIVYVRPSVFRLTPGLTSKGNFDAEKPFDKRALDEMLAQAPTRNGLVRMNASAWLPGHTIGPFRFEGMRKDDPNDVIPHEDRRELRGMRVLSAWLARYDSREANSLDTWIADRGRSDSSPGHVVHYQLDVSEVFGSVAFAPTSKAPDGLSFDPMNRRLNNSYFFDWGDLGRDFVTFGIPVRSWETKHMTPGRELFGYFNAADDFDAEKWKPMYPNAAFSRMSERDGAWMARILARFTPEMIRVLASLGDFSDASTTDYLESVLEKRLHRVLERWLTRVSPVADVRVEDGDRLCGVDLAERRGVRGAERFHYSARYADGAGAALIVARRPGGAICIGMPHVVRDDAAPDGSRSRYVRVIVEDAVARGPLVAHLYDLGPKRGFRLVGLERPLHL